MAMTFASPFVSPIFSVIVQKLVALAEAEIDLVVGVKKELRHLQRKMTKIERVLKSAEDKASSNELIRTWLSELKDTAYDIEDIIDYCWVEGQRLLDPPTDSISSATTKGDNRSHTCSCLGGARVSCSCVITIKKRHKIGKEIKKIIDKLDRIDKEKNEFGLLNSSIEPRPRHHGITAETTERIPEDIVGSEIKRNKEHLVNMITATTGEGGGRISILAIVGMPGIGKTTLAQMIFNDTAIDNFQKKMWIHVSQQFSEDKLLQKMIQAAGGECSQNDSKSALVNGLVRAINGAKFFLVLDDVHDGSIWEDLLCTPLATGGSNSKILVTSRHDHVAAAMGVDRPCLVQPLLEEEAWSLLCNTVFTRSEDSDSKERMREVGIQIVKKCTCLPLAVKSIGGVLKFRNYHRLSEWEDILNDRVWSLDLVGSRENGSGMNALYLSYVDLPFELKQCFIYCSLFPESFSFHQYPIIEFWTAEGFLEQMDPPEMQRTGNRRYDELVARHLLERNPKSKHHGAHKMHDLMRHLAALLGREENYFGPRESYTPSSLGLGLRRLSLTNENSLLDFDPERHRKSLRTLMLFKSRGITSIPECVLQKMKYLRVLSLRKTRIEVLSDSIGHLALLKHLDLSFTPIKSLPGSIGSLVNLMFLLLTGCGSLFYLPDAIVKLRNLRDLTLHQSNVEQMPRGMRGLEQLMRLNWSVEVNESTEAETGRGIEELGYLNMLTALSITCLERLSSSSMAGLVALDAKRHLRYLALRCGLISREHSEIEKISYIFEELCPPTGLQELLLENFFGYKFPSWMSIERKLPELSTFSIWSNVNCESLPQLGNLPQLRTITVVGAVSVKALGPDFFGGRTKENRRPFPRLEKMSFERMHSLEQCNWNGTDDDDLRPFPNLRELSFRECPRLISLWGSLKFASSLTTLKLIELKSLQNIPDLPALRSLYVGNCSSIRQTGIYSVLEEVVWKDKSAEVLPAWLGSLKGPTSDMASTSSAIPTTSPLRKVLLYVCNSSMLDIFCPWRPGYQPHMFENLVSILGVYIIDQPYFAEYSSSPPRTHAHLKELGCVKYDHTQRSSIIDSDFTWVVMAVPGDSENPALDEAAPEIEVS